HSLRRDSVLSPLSETDQLAVRYPPRDRARLSSLARSYDRPDVRAKVAFSDYALLMNISLGTPPSTVTGVVDTGSNLIWTQCANCKNCFKQSLPRFDPAISSTYRKVPYDSTCPYPYNKDRTDPNKCSYKIQYLDGSYSEGVISLDTITMNSRNGELVALPDSYFGCGEDNGGVFGGTESGVIGLGLGPESLTSQLGATKFSYCVPVINKHGFINFGENALVSGTGVVTIPMAVKWGHYYITLEGFTIDGERVNFTSYGNGDVEKVYNMIIDSGAHLTYLPSDNYEIFENAVKKHISAEPLNPSAVSGYTLCYSSLNFSPPTITANFDGGDVRLKSYNTFVYKDRTQCLAFFPRHNSPEGIYGTTAQTNFLVGYDQTGRTVSFKRMACT
uniref:Peptidase A1 domain-containing protein n=1 Tax=Kalanchoe fedtschenkoi TaxID=63787 RepID=A0A7N0UYL1_KALFE